MVAVVLREAFIQKSPFPPHYLDICVLGRLGRKWAYIARPEAFQKMARRPLFSSTKLQHQDTGIREETVS